MRKIIVSCLLVTFVFAQVSFSQENIDERVIGKIKAEGFQNSQIMETLSYLVDVFGPRLTSSPNIRSAQKWTAEKMTSWGLKNSRVEPWGEFGNGWTIGNFSVEMTAPTYDRINAMPMAWSPSTNGVVSGEPMFVSIRSSDDFDKYRGKLKGKIIFNGAVGEIKPEARFTPLTTRKTDEELEKSAVAIDPSKGGEKYMVEQLDWEKFLAQRKSVIKFMRDEGVAVLVEPSGFRFGVVRAAGYYETNSNNNVPGFVIGQEQFARIARLNERMIPVQLQLNLKSNFHNETTAYNVIAEIPGTDPKLKDEVVLLGAHFDSWHGATGAVDNAAGSVAMMEALRILQAIGVKPRRTIRVALWSGEEQDYFGSLNYVKKNYGDPRTGEAKGDNEKLSAYYNLDHGSGKIRGIYLQGNEEARPIFESYLKPFNYLGAKTISSLNTGGTDHMVFDAVGLPGFQFIQDSLDYGTRAHHSNLDVLEAVNEDDLKINAVIIAAFAYQTAMRDERFPRKSVK